MSSQCPKRLAWAALLGAFGLQAQVTIPVEYAYPLSAASAANPGFSVWMTQAATAAGHDDSISGEPRGKTCGVFIGVATHEWKNTAPFVSARVNDDAVESQRMELLNPPLADPSVLSNGLVAYLPFDGNYSDLQGNVTASAVGSPTFEAGKRGQGIHVKNLKDGSLNHYVTLGYPNALKFGEAKDFTVSFWVKQISQAGDQAFISNKDWNSANNRGWGVFSQGGAVTRVQLTGPSGSVDKFSNNPLANLPDGAWHLITVAVARAGNVDTYVDGALALSSPMTVKGNIDTDDLGFAINLGQDGTGQYTDGGSAELDAVLDEVAVWNRALNAQEASALFSLGNAGQSIKVPALTQNLEVYLPFDGTYADQSGKGVVASAVGTPQFEAGPIGQAIRVNNLKDGSVNNYVTLGYPSGLKFGDAGSFTVSFWVKLNSQADDQAFISNKDWRSSNNRGWGIFSQGGGKVRNQFTGAGGSADKYNQTPALGLNDTRWHQVTVIADRAAGRSDTYLDGSFVQSNTLATQGSFDTDDLGFAINLGQDGTGKYTHGNAAEIDAVIDELAVWSRPLGGVEVAGLYAKALTGSGIVSAAPAALKLNGITAAGGNVTITWAGGAGIKLQSAATLGGAWTDVTGSVGASTMTFPTGNAAAFFRLVR
jgi:hypothetical protein